MELSLKGKTALVTGASRGIGLSITKILAEAGAKVSASSRNPSLELKKLGVLSVVADASTSTGAETFIHESYSKLGSIDILINNIGATDNKKGTGFAALTDLDWQEMIDVNLMSVVRMTRGALPYFNHQGGSITNISTMNTVMPNPLITAYSATKAAVTNLSKNLSEQLAPRNIRVNTVSPGPTRTNMWENLLPEDREAQQKMARDLGISLGRFAEPEEIAQLVLFLVSENAAMITGSDYIIDGGLIKTIH